MKSTVEKKSALERKLTVEVSSEKVSQLFAKAYSAYQQKAEIKGFRKGKAPITTVKNLYSDEIRQDVLRRVINENFILALQEHSLNPVGEPNISFDQFEEDKQFQFFVEFEIHPEVKVQQFEGLNVKKAKIEIKPETVEAVIKDLQERNADLVPIFELRPAQDKDVVIIDFKGSVDGVTLEGMQATDYKLELGSKTTIEGFESGIEGMNPGQTKEINVQFPNDYGQPDLAGKPAVFVITLKEIKKKSLPAVDDAFAAKIGSFKTVAELKTDIEKSLHGQEEKKVEEAFRTALLKALVAANPLDVPRSMIQQQKKMLMDDVYGRMQSQKIKEEDILAYINKWDSDFETSATFMVQSSFLISEIADDKKLHATDADVQERLQGFAASTGIDIKNLEEYYKKDDMLRRLQFQIMEDKVMKFLGERANVEIVDKLDEHEHDHDHDHAHHDHSH